MGLEKETIQTVGVIVPAFNESQTITEVINKLKETVHNVLVIDDGSTDETYKLATEAGAIVLKNEFNLGYDRAIQKGFKKAQELDLDYVITFDADGQHCAKDIKTIAEILVNKEHDLVIGIRPNTSRVGEKIFSLATKFRFGVKDPLCGIKGYNMKLYRQRGFFDSYKSIGTELCLYGLINNYSFTQVPITIMDRKGTSRFGSSLKANFKILRALFLSFFIKEDK